MNRACETCEWWSLTHEVDRRPAGECRALPPVEADFPITWADTWCGQYRLAERLAGGHDTRRPA